MNGKRARKIRKLTKTTAGRGYSSDMRISKETFKMRYIEKPLTGELEATQVKMVTVVNAARHTYRQAKKKLKGVSLASVGV